MTTTTPEDESKDLAQQRLASRDVPRPGEVWKHWKGGYYSIVRTSIKEDDLTTLVTYHSNAKGTDWTRTLEQFTEMVPTEWGVAGKVPRFKRVKS